MKNNRYQCIKFIDCLMEQIKQLYNTATRAPACGGVQGYYVDNKYFDARRSREQKILATSKDRSMSLRRVPASNKSTFIDDIKKRQSKLPGPFSYNPKEYSPKNKQGLKVQSPPRITYFDQMQKVQRKFNFPAPGNYDKIEITTNKSKLKSGMSKAQVCSYLQNSMRNSIELPGVGEYNSNIQLFDQRGNKWGKVRQTKGKKSNSERGIKAPQVGTYNPHPLAYGLFQSIIPNDSKKSKSHFNREQRFKDSKTKPIPFYNVCSEWGMKDKLHKKDILSRVGSSLTHHSIYY